MRNGYEVYRVFRRVRVSVSVRLSVENQNHRIMTCEVECMIQLILDSPYPEIGGRGGYQEIPAGSPIIQLRMLRYHITVHALATVCTLRVYYLSYHIIPTRCHACKCNNPRLGWLRWHEVHTPLKGEEGQPTYAPQPPPT